MSSRELNLYKRFHLYLPVILIFLAVLALGADSRKVILSLSMFGFVATAILALRSLKCASFQLFTLEGKLCAGMLVVMIFMTIFAIANGFMRSYEHEYLLLFMMIILFWLGSDVGRARRGLEKAVQGLIFFAGAYCLFSFTQNSLTPGYILGFEKPYHYDRLTGTFLSANTAATLFGVFIFFAISNLYVNWVNWRSRRTFFERVTPSIIVGITSSVCLLLTKSTAGIAMFVLTAAGMLVCLIHYHWGLDSRQGGWALSAKPNAASPEAHDASLISFPLMVWGIIMVLGAGVFGLIFWDIYPLNNEGLQSAFDDRRHMYDVLWAAFQDRPYAGHGVGRLNSAKSIYVTIESNYAVTGQNAAHNILLQWLVQSGVFFTFIMVGLFFFLLFYITSGLQYKRRYWTHVLAIIASNVYIALHGLFDYALELPAIAMINVWILGLGFGYVRRARLLELARQ